MERLTYQECLDFIQKISQVTVYEKKSGEHLPELLKKYGTKSKLLDISGDNKHALVFPMGNKYNVIYFYKNDFVKEKNITSPLRYQSANYRVTCHQINLNEFIIWLDSYRFMAEKIHISKEDSEILEKHNISVGKRKTTRKFLYDAYAKTFAGDKEDLKKVKNVVDKYSKPAQPLLMVFEEMSEKNENIEVDRNDSAVFTRYGFNVPDGKTSRSDVQKRIKENTINGNLEKIISPEDIAIFHKYGITFSPTGEVRGKIKLPVPRSVILQRLATTFAVLAILCGIVYYYWGNTLVPAIRHYIGEKTEKIQANLQIAQIKQELKDIHEDTYAARELYKTISEEFPATLGYVDIHPMLLPLIEESEVFVEEIQEITDKGNELFKASEYEMLLTTLQPYQEEHESYLSKLKIIRRVLTKLRNIKQLNQALKNEWLKEDNVLSTIRNLRSYVFNAQELIDTIHEKELVIDEQYDTYKEKIPMDQHVHAETEIYAKEIAKIEKVILDSELLLANSGDFSEVEKKLKPYYDFKSDIVEGLKNLYENIEQNLDALKTLKQKSTSRNEVNSLMAKVSLEYSQLNTRVEELENILARVRNIPDNLDIGKVPPQIQITIDETKLQMRSLRESLNTANNLLQQDQNTQAKQALIDTGVNYSDVVEKLRAGYDILLEMYQTAKAMEVENSTLAKEYSRQIVYMKRQSDALRDTLPLLQQSVQQFEKTAQKNNSFPNERKMYAEKLNLFEGYKNSLQEKLKSAEDKFEQKDVKGAVDEIKKNLDLIQKVTQSALDSKQFIKEIEEFIVNIIEKEKRDLVLKRSQRLIAKLDNYTTKLKQVLQPIENNLIRLEQEFPVAEGYQYITDTSQKTLTQARGVLTFYQGKLQEGQSLYNQKIYEDVLSLLATYEGKQLSPPNFVPNLKSLQNDLNQKLNQAKLKKRGEGQEGIAQEYIEELEERKRNLQRVIPQLQSNLHTLRNLYPNVLKEHASFVDAEKYIIIGQQEIEEIDDLLVEASELMGQKKFQATIDFLKYYSAKESPGLSYLSLLQTFEKSSTDLLAKVQNPEEKREIERKLLAKQQKEQRLETLKRSPGKWYDEVDKIISEYEKVKPQFISSLQGGSRFVQSAIEVQIYKLKEFPGHIAEIDYLIEFIRANNLSIENELPPSKRKELTEYLQTKTIAVELNDETWQLLNALSNIKNEVRLGGWVEESTLRVFLRNLQSINRKYSLVYEEINSPLYNIEAQIPH